MICRLFGVGILCAFGAGQAQACELVLKHCTSADGAVIEQYSQHDNVFVFRTVGADENEISIGFCPSKASLRVRSNDGSYFSTSDITNVLIPAVQSPREFTIVDIAKQLRQNDLKVERRQLADGHCVCDLPEQPDFPGCPNSG